MRDVSKPSREGERWLGLILGYYVKDMINSDDYVRLQREILDVVRAERRRAAYLSRRQP